MIKRRAIALLAGMGVLCSGLVVRLYFLTGGELSSAAGQQASYTVTAARSRGTIYDTHMTPLVNTDTEYRLSVAPFPEVLTTLSGQLDEKEWESVSERLSGGAPVALSMDEVPDTVEGMTVFQAPVRYSGYLPASHLLGYLDSDGQHGKTGIELLFDNVLNEYAGEATVTYTTDGSGQVLQGVQPVVENTLSRSRGGVVLTLDSTVQKIAQRAADRYLPQGAVVVCEADTGRILAMVSTPGYQPDTVADLLEDERSPLLNRTLCNYNLGSVFKIVTAAAALEGGIPASTRFSCTGRIDVQGVTFHCHNQLGHGTQNMTGGFAQSCNPYFIQLAQRMGGQQLYRMASTLGFDRALTLTEGLQTARAILPGQDMLTGAALANLSFGQGELMATPLHIAQLVGAVVNDGQVRSPSILKGIVNENLELTEEELPPVQTAFSEETAQILREMMISTVQTGTGKAARPVSGGAGGKTGTAETGWKQENEEVVQSWFAGFYPAQDPKVTVVVLAEDADNTGGQCAPAFKQICEQLTSWLNTPSSS